MELQAGQSPSLLLLLLLLLLMALLSELPLVEAPCQYQHQVRHTPMDQQLQQQLQEEYHHHHHQQQQQQQQWLDCQVAGPWSTSYCCC
jgi:hypothetical protein